MKTQSYILAALLAASAILTGCSTGRNGVTINLQNPPTEATAAAGGETAGTAAAPTMAGAIVINTYQGVNRASVGQGNGVDAKSDIKPSTDADVSATGL